MTVASPAKNKRFLVLQGGAQGGAARDRAVPSSERVPAPPDSGSLKVRELVAPASPAVADEDLDRLEVPAAVVCARCGDVDCLGCDPDEERSGFLTIVPWERDGSSLRGLWLTARLATEQPESFFEALPDGAVAPALRFALLSELAAASALMLGAASGVGLLLPALSAEVVVSDGALAFAARSTVVGLPLIALLLVGAHALHALALDRAARNSGGRGQRTRALRFGLYAAGWDIVLGPIGLVALLFSEGPASAFATLTKAGRAPGRASRAFLRGAYGLSGDAAERALRGGFRGAALAVVLAAVVLLALSVAFVVALASRV